MQYSLVGEVSSATGAGGSLMAMGLRVFVVVLHVDSVGLYMGVDLETGTACHGHTQQHQHQRERTRWLAKPAPQPHTEKMQVHAGSMP